MCIVRMGYVETAKQELKIRIKENPNNSVYKLLLQNIKNGGK